MVYTVEQILAVKKRSVIPEAAVTDEIRSLRGKVENHKALAKWDVGSTCDYCHKPYTFSLLIGNCNGGACERSRCVLASMRAHL